MAGLSNGVKVRRIKARSSGGERYLDAVEAWGSNPHVPTIETPSPHPFLKGESRKDPTTGGRVRGETHFG